MLRRLTGRRRWQAAWLLSLIYVLTVLAPSVANAFAPRDSAATYQNTVSLRAHDHAAHGHDHAATHVHDDIAPNPGQGHDSDKATDLTCCGLACISALPAHDIDVAQPDRVLSVTISFVYQEVAGRSPPRLYRPPIS